MFVRMTRAQTSPERIDEAAKIWKEQVLPAARQQAGCAGAILLADRATGQSVTATYWTSETALRASDADAEARRGQIAQSTGGEIVEVDRFELVVWERTAPPKANTFVRVNDIKGVPAKIDDGIRFVNEQVAPAVRQLKGYRSLVMGVNRETGRVFVTTVWESAEDRAASEAALSEQRRQGGQALGAESVKVDNFEALMVELEVPATVGAA
jgi:heme-degrading monooxygenase HmoA